MRLAHGLFSEGFIQVAASQESAISIILPLRLFRLW